MTNERDNLTRELSTAIHVLALFIAQIEQHDAHVAQNRATRRAAIHEGRFDPTILDRIGVLRTGRATWEARVAELRAALGLPDDTTGAQS